MPVYNQWPRGWILRWYYSWVKSSRTLLCSVYVMNSLGSTVRPWAVHWLILPTAGRGALQLSLYNTDSILPSSLQPAVSHGKRVGWVYRESTVESQNNKNTQHIKIEVTYEKLLLLLNQKIAETWWGKTWLERLTLKVPTYKILVSKNLCMRGFIVWFEYRSCKK